MQPYFLPHFVLPLHKHVEYEIMLFTQGNGKQFVGEGVSEYKAGDIALSEATFLTFTYAIPSCIPHLQATRKMNGARGKPYSSDRIFSRNR